MYLVAHRFDDGIHATRMSARERERDIMVLQKCRTANPIGVVVLQKCRTPNPIGVVVLQKCRTANPIGVMVLQKCRTPNPSGVMVLQKCETAIKFWTMVLRRRRTEIDKTGGESEETGETKKAEDAMLTHSASLSRIDFLFLRFRIVATRAGGTCGSDGRAVRTGRPHLRSTARPPRTTGWPSTTRSTRRP